MDYLPEDQPFWNSDPDDRFPAWLISLIAAAIICGAVMWWVV
jgi:hypothetical protein